MTQRLIILLLFLTPVQLFAQNIDIRLLRSINSTETLSSDKFFQFVSNSDGYVVLIVPAGMGSIGLIKNDDKLVRNACMAIAAAAFNLAITTGLKYSINRQRPFVTYHDIAKKSLGGGPSFPSGHTSSAFALAASLSFSYPKWYIIIPSFTWAGTVGYSRVHLGVHYPSDVLAGALIGAGSAWLTHAVNKKLNKDPTSWK